MDVISGREMIDESGGELKERLIEIIRYEEVRKKWKKYKQFLIFVSEYRKV